MRPLRRVTLGVCRARAAPAVAPYRNRQRRRPPPSPSQQPVPQQPVSQQPYDDGYDGYDDGWGSGNGNGNGYAGHAIAQDAAFPQGFREPEQLVDEDDDASGALATWAPTQSTRRRSPGSTTHTRTVSSTTPSPPRP